MWNVENLSVRKEAINLAKEIYLITSKNTKLQKDFSLKDQIQRSSVSIASNIAEWNDRWTDPEFLRFLYIARWSCVELKTQIIILKEISYIDIETYNQIINEIENINKKLNALIKKIKSDLN